MAVINTNALRGSYVGVVQLLTDIYQQLPRTDREDVENQSRMQRLANDFNDFGLSFKLEPASAGNWALFLRGEEP